MPRAVDVLIEKQGLPSTVESSQAVPPVRFRDKAFKSRTLVFADASTISVEKGVVTVSTQDKVAALERWPDFERIEREA